MNIERNYQTKGNFSDLGKLPLRLCFCIGSTQKRNDNQHLVNYLSLKMVTQPPKMMKK